MGGSEVISPEVLTSARLIQIVVDGQDCICGADGDLSTWIKSIVAADFQFSDPSSVIQNVMRAGDFCSEDKCKELLSLGYQMISEFTGSSMTALTCSASTADTCLSCSIYAESGSGPAECAMCVAVGIPSSTAKAPITFTPPEAAIGLQWVGCFLDTFCLPPGVAAEVIKTELTVDEPITTFTTARLEGLKVSYAAMLSDNAEIQADIRANTVVTARSGSTVLTFEYTSTTKTLSTAAQGVASKAIATLTQDMGVNVLSVAPLSLSVVQATPSPPPSLPPSMPASSDGGGLSQGAIIGIAVGGAIGGLLLVGLAVYCIFMKPKANSKVSA